MQTTRYRLTTTHQGVHFTAAVVADLHDMNDRPVRKILERERPDVILIPGDLTEWMGDAPDGTPHPGLSFLPFATSIAPTFYALGNHEIGAFHANLRHAHRVEQHRRGVHEAYRRQIRESGAVLLDEGWTTWNGITIGGLGSGLWNTDRVPDVAWVKNFTRQPGYKLLLCHHPEYYDRYLRDLDIDLTVSGHAHGGQWRIFGRGVYAPDQPLFPRYTSGMHDGRLVISRGTSNTVRPIPRFFNPREVVMITVTSREA